MHLNHKKGLRARLQAVWLFSLFDADGWGVPSAHWQRLWVGPGGCHEILDCPTFLVFLGEKVINNTMGGIVWGSGVPNNI